MNTRKQINPERIQAESSYIYEQLEITVSALLENELNQSGIMGKANWRKKEKRTCRNTSSA